MMVDATLAADKFHSHAGVSVPVNCVKLDETRENWFIKVRVFDWVRVDVALEHLHTRIDKYTSALCN